MFLIIQKTKKFVKQNFCLKLTAESLEFNGNFKNISLFDSAETTIYNLQQ